MTKKEKSLCTSGNHRARRAAHPAAERQPHALAAHAPAEREPRAATLPDITKRRPAAEITFGPGRLAGSYQSTKATWMRGFLARASAMTSSATGIGNTRRLDMMSFIMCSA